MHDKGYAHPEVLVDTAWVAEHLRDPKVVLMESNEDPLLYEVGHIPGAVNLDWMEDLNHELRRDYIPRADLESLLRELGVEQDSKIVLYGDKNNWWATFAFWVLSLYGVQNLSVMDGGRQKWIEEGRELTKEIPYRERTGYALPEGEGNPGIRAFRDDVLAHSQAGKPLLDVRSPAEYWGELLHMADYPQEGSLRGGHIEGAKNVPWARGANADGTFKPADELRAIYETEQGLKSDDEVVAYCRIGERSSFSWFVLTYLLGYEQVRNYDGSWTEWGNAIGLPIER